LLKNSIPNWLLFTKHSLNTMKMIIYSYVIRMWWVST
jgi:hypothetical protein